MRVLGFSLFLFVEFVCFHGTILFPGLFGVAQQLSIAIMIVSLFSKALGLFGSFFLSVIRAPDLKRLGVLGVGVFVTGICMLFVLRDASSFAELSFVQILVPATSGLFIGVGDALINLIWGQHCASLVLKKAYLFVLKCNAIATVLYSLTFVLPLLAQVLLIIVSLVTISVSFLKIPLASSPDFSSEALRVSFYELSRPIFCTALLYFFSGLMPWISGQYSSSIGIMQPASFVSTFILLIILALSALPTYSQKRNFRLENVYVLILSLMATGFLLLPIIWDGYGGVVNVFTGMGRYAATIVLWCLAADSTRRHNLSAATVFGLALGVTASTNAFGRLVGYLGGKSLSVGDVSITAISLISLYLLSMLALFIFKKQQAKSLSDVGTKTSKTETSHVSLSKKRVDSSSVLAAGKKLSARETEVLSYLAQGYTMSDIAGRLSISENTARTHIKRVYRKLDVHSKQDIIERCRELESLQSCVSDDN